MLKMFLITSLVCILTVGVFVGFIVACNTSDICKWKRRLIVTLTTILTGALFASFLCLEAWYYHITWNEGVCPNCKTEWRFTNADHTRSGRTIYYYICDNCGKIIEQKG